MTSDANIWPIASAGLTLASLSLDDDIPDPDDVHKMMDAGYKMAFFPKPKYCVYVSFPFKTALSIYIAIFRVYPKLKDYIFSKGLCAYPAIEIYSSEIEASFTNFWLFSVRASFEVEGYTSKAQCQPAMFLQPSSINFLISCTAHWG